MEPLASALAVRFGPHGEILPTESPRVLPPEPPNVDVTVSVDMSALLIAMTVVVVLAVIIMVANLIIIWKGRK